MTNALKAWRSILCFLLRGHSPWTTWPWRRRHFNTSVTTSIYQSTRHNIVEERDVHQHCCETTDQRPFTFSYCL